MADLTTAAAGRRPLALLLSQHFPPEENAPATRWAWLTAGLLKRGFQVEVLTATWGTSSVERDVPGLVVNRVPNMVPGPGIFNRLANEALVAAKSFFARRNRQRPDLIIATAPPLTTLPLARMLALRYRCPLVCDLRDAWPELLESWREWNQDGIRPEREPRFRERVLATGFSVLGRWVNRLQRRCDLIVTTSVRYADAVRSRVPGRVLCIRNAPAAPTGTYPPPPAEGELRILYLGNVGRAQHLATAVRAAALAQDAGAAIRLRIVGDGAQLKTVRELAEQLNAPVEFHRRVPRSEVGEHYLWADTLLVMLREWPPLTMTVPSKLYEALATGRHISASAAGETAELVSITRAGDVVPPKDPTALARLWTSLAADRSRLVRPSASEWLSTNTDRDELADWYATALRSVLRGNR